MCVRCENENFEISIMENISVDGENYLVYTQDLADSFSMMLSGVTFGDNYAATVVMHTGDLVISTPAEYGEALNSGKIDPEVNKSATFPYIGEASEADVRVGHAAQVMGLSLGTLPAWMTLEQQRQAVLYSTDSIFDMMIGGDTE